MISRDLGHFGAARAADHNDRSTQGEWTKTAWARFLEFILARRMEPCRNFTTEEVRLYAEQLGLFTPHDLRAWGNLTLRALRRKLIRDTGSRIRSQTGHGREIVVFEVV